VDFLCTRTVRHHACASGGKKARLQTFIDERLHDAEGSGHVIIPFFKIEPYRANPAPGTLFFEFTL